MKNCLRRAVYKEEKLVWAQGFGLVAAENITEGVYVQ